jgi:ribosomal protein S16
VNIAKGAVAAARSGGHDIVILDTAGRQTVDEELMGELERVNAAVSPRQVLLVADAMTGQDAVATAQGFAGRLPVSGIILTKIEGDARGGAALSLRAVTGRPVVFVGTGEKLEALEAFYPERIASRILGMGDVMSLIERAEKAYDRQQAEALGKKIKKNEFDLEDFRDQLRAVKRMGSVTELLGMIPGMKKLLKGADLGDADQELRRVEAIINSMTKEERRNIHILNANQAHRARQRHVGGRCQPAAQAVHPDEEGAEEARIGRHAARRAPTRNWPMVKIRLARHGSKKRPFYRIVVAHSESPRDGRFIEQLGYYDPTHSPEVIQVDAQKVASWRAKGAQPTQTVEELLRRAQPAPAAAAPPA